MSKQLLLKPQDIVVLLKMIVLQHDDPEAKWSYPQLAAELFLSVSEVHAAVERAKVARLIDVAKRQPMKRALAEFLVCGVRYAYPACRGSLTRGLPTGYAAPPLLALIQQPQGEPPPVWPDATSQVSGYELAPLYPSVPQAARHDTRLYELLALLDSIRDRRARERNLATAELQQRLGQVASRATAAIS